MTFESLSSQMSEGAESAVEMVVDRISHSELCSVVSLKVTFTSCQELVAICVKYTHL